MIDIGLDSPAAREHLARQLAVIKVIDKLDERLPTDPAMLAEVGSELAALVESAPDAPVNLLVSMRAGLSAARDSLDRVANVLGRPAPGDAVVVQALTRTALLGAGRVVFALGPEDPQQRRQNVRTVLRQESSSLMRGLSSFSAFSHLSSLRPSDEYLAELRALDTAMQGGRRPGGEARNLEEMAKVIGERVAAADLDDSPPPEVLAEHITWVWHAFSGAAHGFGWPRLLPGTPSMAGNFIADLGAVVPVAHLAFEVTMKHCRAG